MAAQADLPDLGFHVATGDGEHIRAAANAGASFVVVVFAWDSIEPVPGFFYWEEPDAALRAADYYGLTVVARLDRPPDWAIDPDTPTPWNLDAYNHFVAKVAQRYSNRLDGVIIWNEPNLAIEWNNQPPVAEEYALMLQGAYDTVKAAAPELPVLLAGPALSQGDGINAINDLAYLDALYDAGIQDHFDILAAHPYGFGESPDQTPAVEQLNFRRIELQHQIMVDRGDGDAPVWITEAGWRTSSSDPADAWQIVTPAEQAQFSVDAVQSAARNYPWLERFGFWDLNSGTDIYGYTLWQGTDQQTLAYQRLADLYVDPLDVPITAPPTDPAIEIVADDVIIRLGEIGTVHPHWVHLYEGGENFSPNWRGAFFLTEAHARETYDLWLETMQIDQPSNRVRINGEPLPFLQPRTRPDPTSTWVTQRLDVPASLLTSGRNEIEIQTGLRNPAIQYANWRWENFQFRNLRLRSRQNSGELSLTAQPLPSPSGWAEINRLRLGRLDHGGTATFWATGNGLGQIWQGLQTAGPDNSVAAVVLTNVAHNRPDLRFVDATEAENGVMAATDQGLFWLENGTEAWEAVSGMPAHQANVIVHRGPRWLAGFENAGLWAAYRPEGPWRQIQLEAQNRAEAPAILDIAFVPDGKLWISASDGLYERSWRGTRTLSNPPAAPRGDSTSGSLFIDRLRVDPQGRLVARHNDDFWRLDELGTWEQLTLDALAGRTKTINFPNETNAVFGTMSRGIWTQPVAPLIGAFSVTDTQPERIDNGYFEWLTATDSLLTQHGAIVATTNGLFFTSRSCLTEFQADQCAWQKAENLPPTVTDIHIDSTDPGRWIASTPAGIYRSTDAGQTWTAISPPWVVWDMAVGISGRLYVARADGVAWTDDLAADELTWTEAEGLNNVSFFRVNPSPTEPNVLWAGTWGNNIGVMTDVGNHDGNDDGNDDGARLASIHNGLETLSVLDTLWHDQPGQFTVATIEGLYRSDDGGASWFQLPGALKAQTVYALHQTADGAIWAGAANGLWVSQDWGIEWRRIAELPEMTVLRIGEVLLNGESTFWTGTESDGLWTSQDGGMTWAFGALAGRTVYAVATDPEDGVLVVATDRGLWRVGWID